MLFEKNTFSDGDVITIKMISGEEVIAKFVGYGNNETQYKIQKPYILANTQRGPALAPFIITGDRDASLVLERSSFVCAVKSDNDMSVQYTEVTTGISLSAGSNIIDFHGS